MWFFHCEHRWHSYRMLIGSFMTKDSHEACTCDCLPSMHVHAHTTNHQQMRLCMCVERRPFFVFECYRYHTQTAVNDEYKARRRASSDCNNNRERFAAEQINILELYRITVCVVVYANGWILLRTREKAKGLAWIYQNMEMFIFVYIYTNSLIHNTVGLGFFSCRATCILIACGNVGICVYLISFYHKSSLFLFCFVRTFSTVEIQSQTLYHGMVIAVLSYRRQFNRCMFGLSCFHVACKMMNNRECATRDNKHNQFFLSVSFNSHLRYACSFFHVCVASRTELSRIFFHCLTMRSYKAPCLALTSLYYLPVHPLFHATRLLRTATGNSMYGRVTGNRYTQWFYEYAICILICSCARVCIALCVLLLIVRIWLALSLYFRWVILERSVYAQYTRQFDCIGVYNTNTCIQRTRILFTTAQCCYEMCWRSMCASVYGTRASYCCWLIKSVQKLFLPFVVLMRTLTTVPITQCAFLIGIDVFQLFVIFFQ